jgi:capsular polysaccharide biosynthesis protein
MFVGSSLTHGSKSNEPPSKLCYDIWDKMVPDIYYSTPKKIYISRRSQLSKHPENIGTNYTQRRKCINEDNLVDLLNKYGYSEVLCEDLAMSTKIHLFEKATHIAGFIGGGMANCIFSKPTTRVLCFETPTFLDINTRFAHSMNHTNVSYINCCKHI